MEFEIGEVTEEKFAVALEAVDVDKELVKPVNTEALASVEAPVVLAIETSTAGQPGTWQTYGSCLLISPQDVLLYFPVLFTMA